jgi:hypothetical protein
VTPSLAPEAVACTTPCASRISAASARGTAAARAGCKIYWREAWLHRVDVHAGVAVRPDDGTAELEQVAQAATRPVRKEGGEEVWRCHATDALKASEPLKTSNLAQYRREFTNGNFGPLRFMWLAARVFVMEVADRVGLLKPPTAEGLRDPATAAEPLIIQPGELEQVK